MVDVTASEQSVAVTDDGIPLKAKLARARRRSKIRGLAPVALGLSQANMLRGMAPG